MMQNGTGFKKVVKEIRCPKCNKPYGRPVLGVLTCSHCGHEEQDDYGTVRTYIEQHGVVTALEIARDTGIPLRKINSFLRSGKLEIPDGSEIYIQCKKCGVDIRFGRYCPNCAREMAKELREAFDITDVGEVPKNNTGKIHSSYFGKNK